MCLFVECVFYFVIGYKYGFEFDMVRNVVRYKMRENFGFVGLVRFLLLLFLYFVLLVDKIEIV